MILGVGNKQSRELLTPGLFFLLACSLSWLLWLPKVAATYGWWSLQHVSPYWHLAGSVGPAVAAIIVTYCVGGKNAVQALLRLAATWRVGWRWWVAAVGGPLFILLLAAVSARFAAGERVHWPGILQSAEYPALGPIALVSAQLVCYGFGEEIGWRGYALPHLMAQYGALRASIMVSVPWAVWHLPLLVTNDTYRSMSPAMLLGWYASLLTGSILLTWLFIRGRSSVLLVALFHAGLDLVMVNSGVTPSMLPVMGALVTVWGIVAGIALMRATPTGREQCESHSQFS